MDYSRFFQEVRDNLFNGSFSQDQVDGINEILDAMSNFSDVVLRNQAAYIFATAYHETGATMLPVRETFAKSDSQAMTRLENAWQAGKLPWVKKPYWRNGWFGRGYVQLTHKYNYKKMEDILGIDLVKNRDLALDPEVAATILVEGMMEGLSGKGDFTGLKLEDYVNLKMSDYFGARRVVTGKESQKKVAGYAVKFEKALRVAGFDTAQDLKDAGEADENDVDDQPSGHTIEDLLARITELERKLG